MDADRDPVEEVRAFNRFYTGRIGLLEESLLGSGFSLTETRVLYELAHREGVTAAELCRDLRLDQGYFSRLARGLSQRGLLVRRRSERDGRASVMRLTEAGRRAFAPLEATTRMQVAALIAPLSAGERDRLVTSLRRVRRMLAQAPAEAVVLRPPRPGDLGWIVHRHGALYHAEHGLDATFEGLVARIVAEFAARASAREACWVADRDGEVVGSAMIVGENDTVARLRLLYVEPGERGQGLGRRLVGRCLEFARMQGYRELTLWTTDMLVAARQVYERMGFRKVAAEALRSFGRDVVGEIWVLALRGDAAAEATGSP